MVIQRPQTSFEGQVFVTRLHEKQQSRNKNRSLTKNILFQLGHLKNCLFFLIIHTADSKTTPKRGLTPRSKLWRVLLLFACFGLFWEQEWLQGWRRVICKNIKLGIGSLSQVCTRTFIKLWPAPGHVRPSHVTSKPKRFLLQHFEVFSALTHGVWTWHRNADVWATYALIYQSWLLVSFI